MKLRAFLLLLAGVSVTVHADDEASTSERMGYTKEWLQANGYRSYQEYLDRRRQPETQSRQQSLAQHVKTTREGPHHRVEAKIVGPLGQSVKVSLLVDTGASTIVLPYSMIQKMGFQADALADASMQTPNGQIPCKIGLLSSVTVGKVSADNVAVGFIPDGKLGTALLGMSFLARFQLTFDDAHNEIILLAK